MIVRTRTSAINRQWPNMREFACRILPLLTFSCYRDLEPDERSFRPPVWYALFKRMVRREVFSDGAKDQFALSLRNGFALATLPQAHGKVPAFIFPDEPVASFDRTQCEAFVELVRTGHIGQRLEQVFIAERKGIFPENPSPVFPATGRRPGG